MPVGDPRVNFKDTLLAPGAEPGMATPPLSARRISHALSQRAQAPIRSAHTANESQTSSNTSSSVRPERLST